MDFNVFKEVFKKKNDRIHSSKSTESKIKWGKSPITNWFDSKIESSIQSNWPLTKSEIIENE